MSKFLLGNKRNLNLNHDSPAHTFKQQQKKNYNNFSMRIIIIIIIAHLKRPAESGLSQDELQHADHRGALATGGQGQGQRSRSPTHTQRHSHAFTYTHANSLTHNPLTHKHPPTLKLTYTDSHTVHTYHTYKHTR